MVGFSGPTLDPGDAIRNARRDALIQLASAGARTTVRVDSELLVSASGQRDGQSSGEFTRQDLSGAVHHARVVAMWAERLAPEHSQTTERHVYALACDSGAAATGFSTPNVPPWVLNVPDDGTRICALGVGGPTRNPNKQPDATLRDARRALGATLESKLDAIFIDTGNRTPLIAARLAVTERARARAEAVSRLEATWRDADGAGPLALKQTLYGLVCVAM